MLKGCRVVQESVKLDNQVIMEYMSDTLGGVIGEAMRIPMDRAAWSAWLPNGNPGRHPGGTVSNNRNGAFCASCSAGHPSQEGRKGGLPPGRAAEKGAKPAGFPGVPCPVRPGTRLPPRRKSPGD